MNGQQNAIDEETAVTAQSFSGSWPVLLARKDNVSNTAVEVIRILDMFDRDRRYSVLIGGSTLSSKITFQQL